MLAVVTIVEDTEGQVERLMLYNWTNPPDMVEAENLKHRKEIASHIRENEWSSHNFLSEKSTQKFH